MRGWKIRMRRGKEDGGRQSGRKSNLEKMGKTNDTDGRTDRQCIRCSNIQICEKQTKADEETDRQADKNRYRQAETIKRKKKLENTEK